MVQLALERVDARDVGERPAADRADRGDEHVRNVVDLALARLGVGAEDADADAPLATGGVVLGADDLVIEFDVLHGVVLARDVLEVRLDLVPRGVERRPVALSGVRTGGSEMGSVREGAGLPCPRRSTGTTRL